MTQGTLDDPYEPTRDVAHVGHHGNGDCELTISSAEKLGCVASLIKQFYKNEM